MSFNFNPLSSLNQNLTNVQKSSKTSDGGAGNTGYFAQGGKKEGKEETIFDAKDYPQDSFEYVEVKEGKKRSFLRILKVYIWKIKKAILKLFRRK